MTFLKKHSAFTWKPILCRWPKRGWSLWWLWFEVAQVGGEASSENGLMAAAPELYEALENDILFFDSIANSEHWEATGIGNLCRGYASRRRDLLAKARAEQVSA